MGKFDPSGLNISEATLALYRVAAERNRRSLEDELSEVIETNRPGRTKDVPELLALSRRLRGQSGMTSDSTPYIRWLRDTNAGRDPGIRPFEDDDAGD